MDRRTFLKAAAAAPCVFGLRELFAQEPSAPGAPEWFKTALARMKERRLHGVVLIAPERVEPDQREMGMALRGLMDGDRPDAHELFLGGVFIGMIPSIAVTCGLCKSDEKDNRILLDPDGRRVASDAIAPGVLQSADAFAASFEPFLFGKDRERLKAPAEELAKTAPEALNTSLRDLGSEDIAIRERASGVLKGFAAEFHPLFAWLRGTAPDPEVRYRLKSILEHLYQSARKETFGPRLPFGTRIPKFVEGGCGAMVELPEGEKDQTKKDGGSMVACGMGMIEDSKVKLFLRFLTK